MSAHAFAAWCEQTATSVVIKESTWMFPAVLVVHLIGLAWIGATVLTIDLRLIGGGLRGRSARDLSRDLRRWRWGGLRTDARVGLAAVRVRGAAVLRQSTVPGQARVSGGRTAGQLRHGASPRAATRRDATRGVNARHRPDVSGVVVRRGPRWVAGSGSLVERSRREGPVDDRVEASRFNFRLCARIASDTSRGMHACEFLLFQERAFLHVETLCHRRDGADRHAGPRRVPQSGCATAVTSRAIPGRDPAREAEHRARQDTRAARTGNRSSLATGNSCTKTASPMATSARTVQASPCPTRRKARPRSTPTSAQVDPEARCIITGIPRLLTSVLPFEILQTPQRLGTFHQLSWHRWVWLDGRSAGSRG